MAAATYIAEIGVNHLGSSERAAAYVDRLVATAINGLTVQVREPAFYDGSQPWRRELSLEAHAALRERTHNGDKLFGVSVGDLRTAMRLSDLRPDFWKVLSFASRDAELLTFLLESDAAVYVSTGLSDDAELVDLARRFPRLKLIHTQLSADPSVANLSAIEHLRTVTGLSVSYGLHCPDRQILAMALCYRPDAVFFYAKGDEKVPYPDDEHALPLSGIGAFVANLRRLEEAIGSGIKSRPRT